MQDNVVTCKYLHEVNSLSAYQVQGQDACAQEGKHLLKLCP
jgi:hypothetical protein